jgi:hypothetical protein
MYPETYFASFVSLNPQGKPSQHSIYVGTDATEKEYNHDLFILNNPATKYKIKYHKISIQKQ